MKLLRPLLTLLLCTGLYLLLGASAQDDPRQAPPAGRALPPRVEDKVDEGSNPVPSDATTAPQNDYAEQASLDSGAAAASSAERLSRAPSFRLPRREAASSTRTTARLQDAPVLASEPAVQPAGSGLPEGPGRAELRRGKYALDNAQWRRFGLEAAPQLPPQALPAAASSSKSGLHISFAPDSMLDLHSNILLAAGNAAANWNSHQADFLGKAGNTAGARSAPVELVLPQPPPRMPLPNVRPGLNELSRGNSKRKQVALTFDDGPHPEYTSQLLTILDYYDAPATFFLVGVQSQKYPQWVKMIHQAGHEIANHTYDHFRLPDLPAEEKAYQLDECTRLLEQLTGTTPRFMRPPGGRYNEDVERLLRQRGMVLALWDVGLNDTAEDREASDLLQTAGKSIRPGSIVLAHDGIQATIDMLPALIESLRKDGYELVTLSQLAAGL